ncbi:DUF2721 domain-containing protein [Sulfuriroseicoccus oceanibius]|uniref:DUF2721 domain-containing protein n=1 Tax=Sulfuriroseicoccus oceanibius TaxID=2707525 RepID=A0A6B3LCB8_9BACT|nr:DUF2721 domain-containing protein [Sulfuriroseicoccus oceanibius]QQL45933.1 DUF2721 domain-containing protein [Sulfuriroseicoccus oceanibius]
MILEISTPALLFPAVSLLFLSFTNRFLHLAALIRKLHDDWLRNGEPMLRAQIENLRRRMKLIRSMQLYGALSLLCCVISMVTVMLGFNLAGWITFGLALFLMGISLTCLALEVFISGGALAILLNEMDRQDDQ